MWVASRERHLLGNDLVREARRRAGLTQRELAEKAGTTQSAIARLENGHTSPSFEKVLALVRDCGFDLEVLLVERDDTDLWQARDRLQGSPEDRLVANKRFDHLARELRRAFVEQHGVA